jgi:hypothetical protein
VQLVLKASKKRKEFYQKALLVSCESIVRCHKYIILESLQ